MLGDCGDWRSEIEDTGADVMREEHRVVIEHDNAILNHHPGWRVDFLGACAYGPRSPVLLELPATEAIQAN